ncbi:PEP-CTERM sorting domain-containing protein [Verrucomicrobiaceae bacterium N1E253]|uniref:PEP-CTERM sorting domain-containing protein n=1 Tax=Oceaniferula marina TaxID=2748318 RepID=A0A851GF20_9BACT|nr:PEP-CTERM sorting domain-containing protein [Oceaniferula marina]NWK55492.1 PEP-CTERM sorting domain-containing protein [Oceaniferula marina]
MKNSSKGSLVTGLISVSILGLPLIQAATLKVDFNVNGGSSGTASGYTSISGSNGSDLSATSLNLGSDSFQVSIDARNSDGSDDGNTRWIDRENPGTGVWSGAAANPLSQDWVSTDDFRDYLVLTFSGLEAGTYDLTTIHGDWNGNTVTRIDVQGSVNGGTSYINLQDGPVYDARQGPGGSTVGPATVTIDNTFTANGADDVIFLFHAGANKFGDAGNTGSSNVNRFVALNGFELSSVPEPSSTVLLGLGGLAFVMYRRK